MTAAHQHRVQTGHIGLSVSDLARSLQFYQAVFGWDILGQSQAAGREYAFLGAEGALLLTLWPQSAGRTDHGRPGLHHLSFQAADIAAVRAFADRLRSLEIPVLYDGIVPHGEGMDSGGLFFEDPDGIRLEIFSATGAGGQTAPIADGPTCGFF
jgi:lactoylglutathione lyase